MADPLLGSGARPLRVAIIGSGPSAFYAAEALFKAEDFHVHVDMYDALPTPYGLVRGGVAPDHQKIKSVIRVYEKIAANDGFRFFGNVTLGTDVQVADLTAHYDHLVYAVGALDDRKMGIPGEDLDGVHSATEFVGWYNSHPAFVDRTFDLENATRVAVVGNGNVAMDVTRILVESVDTLAATDIADYALEALRKSKVREVILLGRRGPAQAAFSPKEIQEIAKIEHVDVVVSKADATLDEYSEKWLESQARSAQRNVEFVKAQAELGDGDNEHKVLCRFCVSPVEISADDAGRVTRVRIEKNELSADDRGTPRPRGTGEFEDLDVQIVFRAVGYRGEAIEGVPFHESWGIIPNRDGRVLTAADGEVIPGQYVVGWAKRGPTGLIGTNSPDSKLTVEAMLEDARGKTAAPLAHDQNAILELLRERGVRVVTFADWKAIDQREIDNGQPKGKVRDKFWSVDQMLEALG